MAVSQDIQRGKEKQEAGDCSELDDSLDSGNAGKADLSFSYVHQSRPVTYGHAASTFTPRDDDDDDYGSRNNHIDPDMPLSPALSDAEEEEGYNHIAGVSTVSDGSYKEPSPIPAASKPVISLVETSFGMEELDKALQEGGEEAYYVVEEDSDED